MDLTAFVLYASAAGILGGPGLGNYAAANTFLDALAQRRKVAGLPGLSIDWGLWEERSEITGRLTQGDIDRIAESSMVGMPSGEALAMFDAALADGRSSVFAARLDLSRLRNMPDVPYMLRALVRPSRRSAAAAQSAARFRARLAAMPAAEREAALIEIVRERAAMHLGLPSVEEIRPDDRLLEQGLNSVTAMELRNSLAVATGLRLRPTVVFDHPTPSQLARLLADAIATEQPAADGGRGGTRPAVPAAAPAVTAAPSQTAGETEDGPLSILFRRGAEVGKPTVAIRLALEAARLRDSFSVPAEAGAPIGEDHLPSVVRIARGPMRPTLICFTSFVMFGGVHQYLRFAAPFQGEQDLAAVTAPGFGDGENLPDSIEAVTRAQAEAILRFSGDDPIVVAGASSGGILAYATATRLEQLGHPVSGVVLLDSYIVDDPSITQFEPFLLPGLMSREGRFLSLSDNRISAMAWYADLFGTWRPEPISAPTLLVRATEPMIEDLTGMQNDWRSSWPLPTDVVDVPGNHYNIVEENSPTTAKTVRDWIAGLA
jgi:thioesterase domain-containing protein